MLIFRSTCAVIENRISYTTWPWDETTYEHAEEYLASLIIFLLTSQSLSRRDENLSWWGFEFFRQHTLCISNITGQHWPSKVRNSHRADLVAYVRSTKNKTNLHSRIYFSVFRRFLRVACQYYGIYFSDTNIRNNTRNIFNY
jgi:hypothetical protein